MSQKRYGLYFAEAAPGKADGCGLDGITPYKNGGLNAKNTWTIAVPASPDDSDDYSINVEGGLIPSGGVTASFAADADSTQAEVAAGLLAAIQASEIADYFSVSLSGSTMTLVALEPGIDYTVTSPSDASTTADLTVSETVTAALASKIPFGRYVCQSDADDADDEARLATAASGMRVLGVTRMTYDEPSETIGDNSEGGYRANVGMDVVHQARDGIWVRCDAADIVRTDTVYIDTQEAANLGGLTKTSSNNIAHPASCQLLTGSTQDADGKYCVKVRVNLP
mgnify:CR=1 FL=1